MTQHGISVGIERINDAFMMTLTINGKLKHSDYEIIVPMLESAIAGVEQPKINALVDMREFNGWELRAAWDDLKLGLKHGRAFTKIAMIGNKKWEEYAAKVGSWFIAGDIIYFEDKTEACNWLNKSAD